MGHTGRRFVTAMRSPVCPTDRPVFEVLNPFV